MRHRPKFIPLGDVGKFIDYDLKCPKWYIATLNLNLLMEIFILLLWNNFSPNVVGYQRSI